VNRDLRIVASLVGEGILPRFSSAEIAGAGQFEQFICGIIHNDAEKVFSRSAFPRATVFEGGRDEFADGEAVLYDILELLRHNSLPNQRARLTPIPRDVPSYWELK
jgi:hypothetical protein